MDHCSVSWEITILYYFSWNCTWFGQKESIKVQNFRLSTGHVKFYQICTLMGSLKYIKLQPRSTEEFYLMTLKIDVKFEEKLMFCFKNDKNLVKFDLSTGTGTCNRTCSLTQLHFHLLLLCKVFNIWPKKVQRSYLSWHWKVMQNFKKNWLLVWKMTWGIW